MLRICMMFLALSLTATYFLYFLYNNEKTKTRVLLEETQNLKIQLTQITDEHAKLKKLCELDKHKIENRYKTLLQKAMQKPKTVEIPVFIEKPIYIIDEDCQRLGVMIDEAFEILKAEGTPR